VVGAGGIGKSLLTQHVLAARRQRYEHGVCWIELGEVADATALPGAVAAALGVQVGQGDALAALVSAVSSLTMLLAVIVGGSGRFFGPVVGTIIIILLPELLRSTNVSWLKFMQTWYLAVFGIAVVALMIWLPGGILSIGDRFKSKGTPR